MMAIITQQTSWESFYTFYHYGNFCNCQRDIPCSFKVYGELSNFRNLCVACSGGWPTICKLRNWIEFNSKLKIVICFIHIFGICPYMIVTFTLNFAIDISSYFHMHCILQHINILVEVITHTHTHTHAHTHIYICICEETTCKCFINSHIYIYIYI